MELLDPLAVEDVGLLTGDVLELAGVDQVDLEAACFQQFVEPVPSYLRASSERSRRMGTQ
jgi:hypothetical protein